MTDDMLVEVTDQLFAELCTGDNIQSAEETGWFPGGWDSVARMGLPWIGISEPAGGQGGSLCDALAILSLAGRHALPLPLAETGILGGWLLASAGLAIPTGPLTVVPAAAASGLRLAGKKVVGSATAVPWARSVEAVVVLLPELDGSFVVSSFAPADLRIEPRVNLAGEPRDIVHFDGVPLTVAAPAEPAVTLEALRVRGALSRVALIAGALDRLRDLTVGYTSERQQFGQPLNRFQAVQQHLVLIAEQAALVGIAAQVAAREAERGSGAFEVASAKILAGDAARIATRAAHQAHGAMGMTQEYPLHHATRRLWAWATEYGNSSYWSRRLGRLVIGEGADQLYPLITGGSNAVTRVDFADA
jgi:acyl-CoA dehydrogenase